MPQLSLHSPVGDLSLSEEDGALVALDWGWGRDQTPTPLLKEAVRQLNAYFDGKLTGFDLPLFKNAFGSRCVKSPTVRRALTARWPKN
jgi:methylated-DNA-[protein]-cysteine S-methyltransferase